MTTPEQLATRLTEVLPGAPDVAELRRLTGGASRETWSLEADGRPLILQRARPGSPADRSMNREADLLRAAHEGGVPVAEVVAAGPPEGVADEILGSGYLVCSFVHGETIARKIQRDDAYAEARPRFAADCGRALAAIHAIDPARAPGLDRSDQVTQFRTVLDDFGDPVPAFETAFRWLEANRPERGPDRIVHGDFRLGNLIVGDDGVRAVVDWELAHLGDPMEDLGWLCVRAWRFGGPGPVGGLGSYDDLFAAYEAAGGGPVDPGTVRWWEVLGTLKWGIMCIMQARAHLDGFSRSVELAAIGRRVCENEHDLMLLLAPEALAAAKAEVPAEPTPTVGLFGRPTAAELVEATREWIEGDVRTATSGRVAFHSRVAANVLATVERELALGPSIEAAAARRLGALGVADEAALAAGVRSGDVDPADDAVAAAIAGNVVDKLRVANPRYLT